MTTVRRRYARGSETRPHALWTRQIGILDEVTSGLGRAREQEGEAHHVGVRGAVELGERQQLVGVGLRLRLVTIAGLGRDRREGVERQRGVRHIVQTPGPTVSLHRPPGTRTVAAYADSVASDPVRLVLGEPVARLVLDRPERRNALSLAVMREMLDALDAIAADSVARVLVIEGNGPAFSAGHDLAEMVDSNRDAFYESCSRPA